ncbi:hypothetical protein SAMN05216548_10127 [Faunimonas pinastri]|uniref:DUF378 domain-containing protein n=1 Tax=Faunimonas pinastri TaxID=1855383 RepID=A0A1H8Z3F7_9HYPH|nr:DUF378 domain-containing protein [Faunimonas pinastri]SEP58950.1 hypothetical protein SAMN05216548_10127 [Faunimonas pinastri]
MRALNYIALILIIIGGLNWLLVGAFSFNLVDAIFGAGSALSRIIYVIVGLAALYALTFFRYLTTPVMVDRRV